MPPHDVRRPYKRPAISDQDRRRAISLRRQEENRRDAQLHARRLASTLLSLEQASSKPDDVELVPESEPDLHFQHEAAETSSKDPLDVRQASKLRGADARKWFARQLMLPEWMIDVPDRLPHDWFSLSLSLSINICVCIYNLEFELA